MTQKDKYLLTELGLTFLLLITAVLLLKPVLFWQYQLLLAGGSIIGFAFSWYTRKRALEGISYITDAVVLITVAWIAYRIFKSTFLYKEVIAILIQGVIILEVIFSFNIPGKTAYLWLLSLLVFMVSPVFAVTYNILLAIVYLLVWLAILRFQFTGFSQPFKEKGPRRYFSLSLSLVCFLVILLLVWLISANVYLGRIKKGMLLLDEDQQDMGAEGGRESNQADKFYSLQDDLQKKITGLALKLDSYEKRRQLIYLFSELVKESIKTLEVDKAESGLVDILKREGVGLDGAAQAISLTKGYLYKKNSLNLQKNKEDFMDALRKYPLSIIDKIKIISLANKIQESNSYQQSQENSQALQAAIKNAALNKDAQKDLKALARNLFNLKAFELYRRKIRDLEQRPLALDEEIEKKIADVVSDIGHTQGLNDFKQTAKKIRQLKDDPRISEQKSGKEVLKSLEEVSRLKLDLFFAEKSEQVRKDASQKQDLGSTAEGFDQGMDEVGSAKNHQDFIKKFSELSQQNKDNNLDLANGLKEMLDLKTESFKQAAKDKIDNLMGKDISSGVKKELLEAAESMEEKDNSQDLERQSGELGNKIKELERKGDIPSENASELLKAAANLKDLLDAKLQAEADLKKEEVSEKSSRKSDYIDQLQQSIENSSLGSRDKEKLKALSEQLLKAQSLSQLEDVKEALEKEISSLGSQPGASDKDRKDLSAAAKKISADLEKKIDNLENATTEQIRQLQESLKKMQQSQEAQELQKNAQEFKEAIKSNTTQDKQEQDKMLEAAQKLEKMLEALLEKKAPTTGELREINKINEKIKQATEIKQQFLTSEALAEILEKIEKLSLQDSKKAQALKEKLEQMRENNTPEEVEKIILDLKNIANSDSVKEDKKNAVEQKDNQQWKIYILSSSWIVSQGVIVPLKVIAVDKNGYIKELTSDVEWFSTDQQIARVDDLNFLHPLAKGKTKIRVVYKGASSKDTEVDVVEDIDVNTVQTIKQELLR